MASSTLSDLGYKYREYLGEMNTAWSWPKMFMASDGESLVGLETWDAGTFATKGYGKEKHYEWPIEWSAPFPITVGKPSGDVSVSETGSHAKMYAKKVYASIKLDKDLAEFRPGDIKGVENELDYRQKLALGALESWYQQVFWGDGTGRRARVYSIDEMGGATYSRIYLRRITQIHVGTTACGGADAPYIVVTPQIPSGSSISNPTYYYVFGEVPGTALTADKEPQGANAWIGKGYNAHTNAATGANSNSYNSIGRRVYADVDRYTDDTYQDFRGHNYNETLATPCAAVALTTAVLDDWLTDFYKRVPQDSHGQPYRIDAFVANAHLRSKFASVFSSQGTVFLNDTEIPHKIGWRMPAIIDSYGPGLSRVVPIFFAEDAPRNSIWGFCFKPLKHAIVQPGAWSPGDAGYGIFRDVSNITYETDLQALYSRTEMFIQHRPRAQTSMFWVTE